MRSGRSWHVWSIPIVLARDVHVETFLSSPTYPVLRRAARATGFVHIRSPQFGQAPRSTVRKRAAAYRPAIERLLYAANV